MGSVDGHAKSVNAVDYKPTRPFRICTASEDTEVGFFEGPPFKFHHFNKVGSIHHIAMNSSKPLLLDATLSGLDLNFSY